MRLWFFWLRPHTGTRQMILTLSWCQRNYSGQCQLLHIIYRFLTFVPQTISSVLIFARMCVFLSLIHTGFWRQFCELPLPFWPIFSLFFYIQKSICEALQKRKIVYENLIFSLSVYLKISRSTIFRLWYGFLKIIGVK